MNINLVIFLVIVACVLSFILGMYVSSMKTDNRYLNYRTKMMKQAIKIQALKIKNKSLK